MHDAPQYDYQHAGDYSSQHQKRYVYRAGHSLKVADATSKCGVISIELGILPNYRMPLMVWQQRSTATKVWEKDPVVSVSNGESSYCYPGADGWVSGKIANSEYKEDDLSNGYRVNS